MDHFKGQFVNHAIIVYIYKMSVENMKKYNEVLKELREDNDLTQQQIADILNTTRSYYGQYERGTRPFPIEHLITLCDFYKVSADYILGLPENLKFPKR